MLSNWVSSWSGTSVSNFEHAITWTNDDFCQFTKKINLQTLQTYLSEIQIKRNLKKKCKKICWKYCFQMSWIILFRLQCIFPFGVNTLRPRQKFTDNIFKCIFLNENVWISLKISLRFVPKLPINNIPALVPIMARRRAGNKPLSEPMMAWVTNTYMCHLASMS